MNMSCNDIASILDTHRSARLAPAERARVDAHLAACADCTAAWHAQNELLALRVPAMPATLLERALLASRLPQSAPARRARLPVIVGSVLLAGAAAAAVTIVSMTREPSAADRILGGGRAVGRACRERADAARRARGAGRRGARDAAGRRRDVRRARRDGAQRRADRAAPAATIRRKRSSSGSGATCSSSST